MNNILNYCFKVQLCKPIAIGICFNCQSFPFIEVGKVFRAN
jgi:hypothetical protein